jgi:AraC-like DNA-binding protein
MTTAPQTASHLVGALVAFARERGVELAPPAASLAPKAFGAFLDEVATALEEPHLGLVMPGALRFARYEIPELAARSSATLREAMQRLVKYSALLSDSVTFNLSEGTFSHRVAGHPRGVSRHLNEFAMAMGVHQCLALTGKPMRVREVRFVNARPSGDLERLRQYFGTTALRFGHAENALSFDPEVLDAKVLTADPRLLATVEGMADAAIGKRAAGSFAAAVERRLREQLEVGEHNVRRLALSLHMSTRTLQRRLDAEGTRYADLLDGVREALARELVAAPQPSLSEVAFRLGFSEFATFARAFKRWTGSAPGAFRAGHEVG